MVTDLSGAQASGSLEDSGSHNSPRHADELTMSQASPGSTSHQNLEDDPGPGDTKSCVDYQPRGVTWGHTLAILRRHEHAYCAGHVRLVRGGRGAEGIAGMPSAPGKASAADRVGDAPQ